VSQGHYDTLIVGAGVAGLIAARELARAGQRVAVIEARNRVGGRIFTERTSAAGYGGPLPVELGAEFIHGLPEETWALVREGGLSTYELQGSHVFLGGDATSDAIANGATPDAATRGEPSSGDATDATTDATAGATPRAGGAYEAATRVLEDMERWVRANPGRDMTFADYLRLAGPGAAGAQAASAYVEGFNAADRKLIGVAALVKQQLAEDEIEGDRVFHVRGGYDRVPQLLTADLETLGIPVLLEHMVRRISWRPGEVSIQADSPGTGTRTLRAARAVITLPLGVLQSGSVSMDPEPTAVSCHAQRLRMGAALRMTLVFESPFWHDEDVPLARAQPAAQLRDLSFLFTPQLTPSTWWTTMPERSPAITGWVGGPRAETLQRRVQASGDPKALLQHLCLGALSAAFGLSEAALGRRLTSSHWHDWSIDPHSLGAYSYAPAGALDASDRMAVPVADTLYFAGEHTDTTGHWGTVHGALRSGLRAARQILSGTPG
jgi:monoamine oxidase